MSSSEAVVGFFPTMSGHRGRLHLGHGFGAAAAWFIARKLGGKFHLDCTIPAETPDSVVAHEIGVLSSLVLPDRMTLRFNRTPYNRLCPEWELERIHEAASDGRRSEIIDPWIDANGNHVIEFWGSPLSTTNCAVVMLDEFPTVFGPSGSGLEGLKWCGGTLAEYLIQGQIGVTTSVDGMDIKRHLLPHWNYFTTLFGEERLYWDARFVPDLHDPTTSDRIRTTWSEADQTRREYWRLERWIEYYEPIGLLRLFWSWLQRIQPPIPRTHEQLVGAFDIDRLPTMAEWPSIPVDNLHLSPEWIDF